MTRTITITTERIRRVIVRYLRSPAGQPPAPIDVAYDECPATEEPLGSTELRCPSPLVRGEGALSEPKGG